MSSSYLIESYESTICFLIDTIAINIYRGSFLHASPPIQSFLRLGAARRTDRNGLPDFARPGCVTFQTTIAVSDETKAGFKGLEKDPNPTGEKGNGPGNEPKEQKPENGKAGIGGHLV